MEIGLENLYGDVVVNFLSQVFFSFVFGYGNQCLLMKLKKN